MIKSSEVDLWQQTKPRKSDANGYWVLWPLVLLFLFQPSFHRPMAALPLVILAVSRERNAGWAWSRAAFWVAFALFGLALIGDDFVPIAWLADGDVRRFFIANPYLFVLPGLGGCGLVAVAFASARQRGWINAGQLDRFRMQARSINRPGLRPIRPAPMASEPTLKRSRPRLHELLAAKTEKNNRFKALSDQHALLAQQGDHVAAARLQPACEQAKLEYDAACQDVQRLKDQLVH